MRPGPRNSPALSSSLEKGPVSKNGAQKGQESAEQPLHEVEPFVHLLEALVDLLETPIHVLEPLVDLFKSLVHLVNEIIKTPFHRLEAPVHGRKAISHFLHKNGNVLIGRSGPPQFILIGMDLHNNIQQRILHTFPGTGSDLIRQVVNLPFCLFQVGRRH